MADNQNEFAAPAAGQQVSFAFDPRGEVPQQKPITSQGPRISIQGVSGMQRSDTNVNVSSAPDPTAQLLMKAGGEILNKQLGIARNEQYVQGMQRAMSGEAIAEVKESVPWYAKLFGDTPVIEGARAYTAQDMVNKTLTRETANIKNLEQMSPDQASRHFANLLQTSQTGDRATDGIIMKQMTDQMPALMKAQAKAHYAYNQRRASAAMAESIISGGSALQQFGEMYAADQVSEADMKVRAQQYVMSVLPPDGIDEESYQKTLTSSLLNMAQSGSFHAIEALKGTGVLSALTPDQATRVEAAIVSKAKQARDDYAVKYSRTISEIKSDAQYRTDGDTTGELEARIDRANAAFQKLTGSPEPLFTGQQKVDLLTKSLGAFRAEEVRQQRRAEVLADQNATADAKLLAQQQTDKLVRGLVSQGDVNLAKKLTGVSGDSVDLAFYEKARRDPVGSADFLQGAWAKGYVSPLISRQLQAGLNMAEGQFIQNPGSPPPDSFFESVTAYRAMTKQGGVAFANAYFGDHAKAMSIASYMLKDNVLQNPNAGIIYQRAMNAKNVKGDTITRKEQDELVKKVTSEGSSWLPAFLGGHSLRPDAIRAISDDVTEGVSQWMAAGLSKEEAAAMAISDSLGPDAGGRTGSARGELLGGFYVRRNPLASNETISTLMEGSGANYTAIPLEERGRLFKDFMADFVKVPKDAGTVNIFRQPDAGGASQFVVSSMDKDGVAATRVFTSLQLQEYAAKHIKISRTGRFFHQDPDSPRSTAFGPDLTFTAPDAMPSPYASAADWAAYRAKQQKSATLK